MRKFFSKKRRLRYMGNQEQQEGIGTYDEDDDDGDEHDLFIERIRIQNMNLRLHSTKEDGRAIYVKHFKHIPMADMELVLPEKKNPGLTPFDWVKFLISAAIGLVTVITQLCKTKANLKVLAPICSADQIERYSSVDVKKANDFIGTTTEEVVTNASQGEQ
ncbi:hypothetical protein SOVF_034130 [Spinacia oleracea]|nr:hypothetical protein SOVF_034130 [Spinacia oleracea]